MKRQNALGFLVALFFAATSPSYTQTADIVTLMSPNEESGGNFGISVGGPGDINQDGFADLLVGAVHDGDTAGRAYVFSGQDRGLLFEFVSPNQEPLGRFGHHVSAAGDVNQDGSPDVIVGASHESPGTSPDDAGRAYVFSGRDGSLLVELKSPNEQQASGFGFFVAGAGDVDRDGTPDLIVGARFEDSGGSPPEAGRAYVFSGRNGSVLLELVSPNEEAQGQFGFAVAGAGDINRDGFADVIVGASDEDPGTSPDDAGRAYVFSGQDGSVLFELTSPNEQEDGYLGKSVAGIGDFNQDGFPDVIVGAYRENPGASPVGAGRAYVFSGQDASLLFEFKSPNEEENGIFGWDTSEAGDVNGDGWSDLIIGAYGEIRSGGHYGAGRAYVFSGRDGSVLFQLTSPNQEPGAAFGARVSGAGDVDQDGVADVIVGAALEDPGTSPNDAGRAYLFALSRHPTIHVGDLDRRSNNAGDKWQAEVTTTVHDDGDNPVSGAVVTLQVDGRSRSCTTADGGTCVVRATVPDRIASLTFTVTSVSKSGFAYNPGANHDPDDDSDGRVIVVAQP
jgi:hypothetical protein